MSPGIYNREVDEFLYLDRVLLQEVGSVSKRNSCQLRTIVSVEFVVTFPRDRGAVNALSIEPYW